MTDFSHRNLELSSGHQHFHTHHVDGKIAHHQKLAQGQSPHTHVVACCDSRCDPAMIFSQSLGDIFVSRTIAAIVPDYAQTHEHGLTAALQYSIKGLGAKRILILGHSGCGGMDALVQSQLGTLPQSPTFYGLSEWLAHAQGPYESLVAQGYDPQKSGFVEQLTRAVAVASMRRIIDYPDMRAMIESGTLLVDAGYYDIAKGQVEIYEAASDQFIAI